MNKTDAKKIAETITYEQLTKMFDTAKDKITDWTVVSNVNKSISKGTAWNVLYQGLDIKILTFPVAVKNMIWEFGDYLDEELKISKNITSKQQVRITHQEPIFYKH